jgi:hypothetical protein
MICHVIVATLSFQIEVLLLKTMPRSVADLEQIDSYNQLNVDGACSTSTVFY